MNELGDTWTVDSTYGPSYQIKFGRIDFRIFDIQCYVYKNSITISWTEDMGFGFGPQRERRDRVINDVTIDINKNIIATVEHKIFKDIESFDAAIMVCLL